MPLHQPVRLVARQPRLDEREEQALTEEQPARRLEVGSHSLGTDHETAHEPAEAIEHVVDREERVGKHDPLGGGVRDVALVPERDVLEADLRVPPHDTCEAADPLGDDQVALVRHIADDPF